MIKAIKCEECPLFLKRKEKTLNECDSVFDAVVDMQYFKEKCKQGCKAAEKYDQENQK